MARLEGGGHALSPRGLSLLAKKLAATRDPVEAARLRERITRGFYGIGGAHRRSAFAEAPPLAAHRPGATVAPEPGRAPGRSGMLPSLPRGARMPQPTPDVEPEIVRGDLTEELLDAYLRGPEVAIDTETMGLHTLRDRLCVVQLCDRRMRAALVQIPRESLGPAPARPPAERAPRLKRLLEAEAVLKVFHFARFDVAALRHWLGIAVRPIYCTRTASKLVRTYTDRHGLKDNLLELLDVEVDKAVRHSDWSAAELSPEQVRYAISDVTLLLPLMDKLEAMLVREGRRELAQACFRAVPTFAELDLLGYVNLFEH